MGTKFTPKDEPKTHLFDKGNWKFVLHDNPFVSFTIHNTKKKDAINYVMQNIFPNQGFHVIQIE